MTHEHKKPSSGRSPVSVRLTHEERTLLEQAAGDMSLSRYIRFKLFQADRHNSASYDQERLSPAARQKLLAQILSSLGKSELSVPLAELAELTRLGLLPNGTNVAAPLAQARGELSKLRHDLLRALGLRPKDGGTP
ncbi:hypothetical protein JQV19_06250 [Sulfitobacter mediterraneus]|uniref:hypothetical protein n=1 Tax=Sulfitobacter mediterraneus TaxID=83219 RepID=UPI00193A907D|nr:hypothetical protein [Sulfitobacter mediterraneus]MBM1556250.1 hypothetical protein [Sulfitobacter mediterraneus]MBM1567712.1 hypothetical protein [Sulfitobacter mediterraneus]MBM1571604.1 hypothetical protein [Sulfitobacter mediterraneus]MBM1575392.1 hypothetical protein [Sulfitobacter mediterraneus]MBM1579117.1 hypothetical protein [Sulfitobacter mediterraneus]